MSEQLKLMFRAVGEGHPSGLDYLPSPLECSGCYLREGFSWKKSALEIKWDAAERVFFVEFTGKSADLNPEITELLSKRVPLQIARSSTCECGATLELGDYKINLEDSNFAFHGEFFCPACKARLRAEKGGLRAILEAWFKSLHRVEIKAMGVRLDRTVPSSDRSANHKS